MLRVETLRRRETMRGVEGCYRGIRNRDGILKNMKLACKISSFYKMNLSNGLCNLPINYTCGC